MPGATQREKPENKADPPRTCYIPHVALDDALYPVINMLKSIEQRASDVFRS